MAPLLLLIRGRCCCSGVLPVFFGALSNLLRRADPIEAGAMINATLFAPVIFTMAADNGKIYIGIRGFLQMADTNCHYL